MSASLVRLTGGRLLARNALVNVLGSGAPMLVALFAIPLLLRAMGTERFGVLTVAWVVIGYFSLFDLGLGRALTKIVAERLGTEEQSEIPSLCWTALFLMVLLGVLGALVLAAVTPWIVGSALKIPDELHRETLDSFYLLAFSLPWVISAAGLRGILEANQSFGLVNAIRVPMGLFTYLGPLLVLPFSSSLAAVTAALVLGRMVAWVAHAAACLRVLPQLRRRAPLRWREMGALARFGGWITVSNIVSPLMNYMDRFLIGGLISMAAVAYYVTPYEMVTKLGLVPSALMGVFFPAFAASFAFDRKRTVLLFDRAVRIVLVAVFPITLLIVTFAYEGLYLWLGAEFARNSTAVLQWLAVGIFVNCLAQVPFGVVQGIGRPDVVGKLHLLELPVYAAVIWALSRPYGIEGVAIAWVLRVVLDTAVLFLVTERLLPSGRQALRGAALLGACLAPLLGAVFLLPDDIPVKAAFALVALAAFAWAGWRWILDEDERALVRAWISRKGTPGIMGPPESPVGEA